MRVEHAIDALTGSLGRAVRWLALAMVCVTLIVVVLRYGFSVGAIGLQESVMYMHGLLFLLGIPYGLRRNTHVRVDLVYARLDPTWQRRIDLAGHCLFALPLAIFIVVICLPYTSASWRVLEGSPEVGGLPAIFLLKTLLPVMGVLLGLQTLAEIVRLWRTTRPSDRKPSAEDPA